MTSRKEIDPQTHPTEAEKPEGYRLTRRQTLVGLTAAAFTAYITIKGVNERSHKDEVAVETVSPDNEPIGVDVSWPQEDIDILPEKFPFAIVGITGGLPTTPNPQLRKQLEWASKAEGGTEQPLLQFYINTANPGEVIDQITTWPTSNVDQTGFTADNPYGECEGENTLADSWQYGWNRVTDIIDTMLIPAADESGITINPSEHPIWLDVERDNTWQSGSKKALERNVATLEGMAQCLAHRAYKAGIYSGFAMWDEITGGLIAENSILNGLDSWVAGAEDKEHAAELCNNSGFTKDSTVTLVQYVSGELDCNRACN